LKPTDARKAYNDLARYFGLQARSAFNGTESGPNTSPPPKSTPKSEFLSEIFGQNNSFLDNKALEDKAKDLDPSDFCAFTFGSKDFGGVGYEKYNNKGDDQGWGVGTFEGMKSMLLNNVPESNVLAMQVFPINVGLDVTDTEIASLFLNSLNTLSISQAVPYLDVKIVTTIPEGERDGNFKSAPRMSLGRFLGAEKDDAMLGKFNDRIDTTGAGGAKLGVVGGMEIFTTPQTLVDAGNVSYSRELGGAIDAFRPFLGIESLRVEDQFSGGGTISYKSAELSLKLFDKGRLEEISEFVAPRRDPNVKFEITYGWSHPDGVNTTRPSDADQDTRIGKLIDAMRVTEIYTLVNSSYTLATDGSVDIKLTLSMDASNKVTLKRLQTFGLKRKYSQVTISELNAELEDIKDVLVEAAGSGTGRINLPSFVQAPDAGNLISMSDKQAKELKKFAQKLRSGGSSNVQQAAAKLFKIFDDKGGQRKQLITGRVDQVNEFISMLSQTPDPYLRSQSSKYGVQEKDFIGKNQKINKRNATPSVSNRQTYVSFGKLMIHVLTPELVADDVDLQFFFSSFNQNAAGVFDYNIAQFPIPLFEDGGLQDEMTELLKKRHTVTIQNFVRFISEKFLTFDGSKAFGLVDVVTPQKRQKSGAFVLTKEVKRIAKSKKPEDALRFQEIRRENLQAIYGGKKRTTPLFTKPRVNMRIVTKTNNTDGNKKVIRIYFQDLAAGRLMTTAEMMSSLIREGMFEDKEYGGRDQNKRNPKHGELYAENLKKLSSKPLEYIGKPANLSEEIIKELKDQGVKDEAKLKEIEDKAKKYYVIKTAPGNLRKFFFENSPYLLHGTEGSGIIEASLTSETNDNLTSIFLSQRYSGQGDLNAPQNSTNLPFMVHPASLSLTTFGCPMLGLTQKYFVDFATNTTLDNFYACTGINHTITSGEYKTSLEMKPFDAYGAYANVPDRIASTLIKTFVAKKKPPRRRRSAPNNNSNNTAGGNSGS